MINLFGTNRVVPNGYIYTSHKGSEYIYFEGIWFNHKNMKMIDPNKAPQMNEAAKKQIIEHNCNNTRMIGESFNFTGKTYTYVGKNRFTEDGILLSESSVISEVIADDQRVYDVSRGTLDKEWNTLNFFILPPHAEDITIPAGLEVQGYRFIPKHSRFVSLRDGSTADNVLTKKLWAEGIRKVSWLRNEDGNDVLPVNSTIMLRDKNMRAEWNGKNFCDNNGNVVLDDAKSQSVKQQYIQFVQKNPADFPSLTGAKSEKEVQDAGKVQKPTQKPFQSQVMGRYGQGQRTEVREAVGTIRTGNADSTEIPDGFELDSYVWNDSKGKWYTDRNQVIDDPEMIDSLNTGAVQRIQKLNKTDKFPVGSIATYNGNLYTWTGERFYNKDVGTIPEKDTIELIDGYSNNPDEVRDDHKDDSKDETNTDSSTETSTEQSSESTSTIPEGYLITSRAGVQYIRKGGQWISSQTKKPMNSSAAMSIDRAAKAKIDKFNASSDVKIGDKWKSGKGIEYTYVGDDRFISSKGKLAPKSAAAGILDKMRAANKPEDSEEVEVQQDVVQDSPVDSPTTEPNSTEEPAQAGVDSGLESLAQQIKTHPKARKITVLMTRGDKVSLLAADLILSGKEQDAIKILKALNSSDE